MRRIERTSRFKRDYKREKKGRYREALAIELLEIIAALTIDAELPLQFHDHALLGNWKDHRDCHVCPDLILIYAKPDDETLQLVRLGSHAELGL